MKTILVVYTDTALTIKQVSDKKMKKYCFRTEEDLKVVDVIDQDYKYYNAATGELR